VLTSLALPIISRPSETSRRDGEFLLRRGGLQRAKNLRSVRCVFALLHLAALVVRLSLPCFNFDTDLSFRNYYLDSDRS